MTQHSDKELLEQYDYPDTDFMDENIGTYEAFVGRFIIRFSYLELHLNKAIADVLNERSHAFGYVVTAKLKMSDKINLLEAYMKLGNSDGYEKLAHIKSWIPKIRELNTTRNRIAHATWATMQEDGSVRIKVKVDEDSGVWFQNEKITYKDICAQCHVLDDMIVRLENIWEEDFLKENGLV